MKSESSNVLGHLSEVTSDYFVARLTSDLEGPRDQQGSPFTTR